MSVWAVLAAAGNGERLGADRPKAFVRFGELPLLAESLRRLDDSEWVDAIVVAAPPDWIEPSILLAEELGAGKVRSCVPGGATRSESVRAGLAEVDDEAAAVLVHDAARPLVSAEVIERVVTALADGWDAVVPALPVADTVKRVRGSEVLETLDRAALVVAQTPQAFVADVLRRALAGGGEATDCAALVEQAGGRVCVVTGDERLRKITTPEDLALLEGWR